MSAKKGVYFMRLRGERVPDKGDECAPLEGWGWLHDCNVPLKWLSLQWEAAGKLVQKSEE